MGWTILGIAFMIWLLSPIKKQPKQTRQHTTTIYKTVDPLRVQREKERQERQREQAAERERKTQSRIIKEREQAEKKAREREQAADDIEFLNEQLAIVSEMLHDTEKQLAAVRKNLEKDMELNRYAPGAVSAKQIKREQAERDRLSNKVITLRTRVHTINTRRGKAYYKLDT